MARGEWEKTTWLIDRMVEVLTKEWPATVRQTFYALVAVAVIANTDADYKRVSRLLTTARKDGRIPYEWIVDRSRPTYSPNVFQDPEAYARVVAKGYHRDYWTMQPSHVEVWSEKDAILGSIEPVTDKYGVTVRVARGFNSTTRVREVAQELLTIDKPKYIFYVGDHDASGCMMEREVLERVMWHYCDEAGQVELAPDRDHALEFAHINDIHLYRLAIHKSDIIEFDLPAQVVKDTDSRAAWFEEQYGPDTVELNALPPTELRARIARAISELLDKEAWDRAMRVEKVEQASLVDIVKTFAELKVHDDGQRLEL
jgi:hypothetical protein